MKCLIKDECCDRYSRPVYCGSPCSAPEAGAKVFAGGSCNSVPQTLTMIRMLSRSNFSTIFVYAFLFLHLVVGSVQLGRRETSANSNYCFPLDTSSNVKPFLGIPGQWPELHVRLEVRGDIPHNVVFKTYFDRNSDVGLRLIDSSPRNANFVNCPQCRPLLAYKSLALLHSATVTA